jgi:hypothetical protein
MSLPEASVVTEWFMAQSQVIYTISAFGVFLDPGFTFMAGVAVSTAHVFLLHFLNTVNFT